MADNPSLSSLAGMPLSVLQSLPALEPPPGTLPNFIDPRDRGPILVKVASVLLFLMITIYASRVYTKLYVVRKASWDDLTCTIGVLGAVSTYAGAVRGSTKGGIGKHQWDVSVANIISNDFTIPSYLEVVLVPPSLLFVKLTFFLLYLQIFWPMRWLRISVYCGTVVMCAVYGAATVAQFVFATPRPGETWVAHTLSSEEAKATILSVPLSAFGLFIDVVLLILPIAGVWRLQLPTRRKVGITLIFTTGLLACVGSLLSVYFRVVFNNSPDRTWGLLDVELMVIIEMYIGIICACTPALSRMFHHHLPPFDTLRSLLYSRLSGLRSTKSGRQTHHDSTRSHEGPRSRAETSEHLGVGPYTNLDIYRSPEPSYELGQVNRVRTFIGTTQNTVASDDKIHLTHEIYQR